MSVTKYFIKDVSRRLEIDELLQNDLKRAGYSHVELTKSPVGTRVVIYAAKPGMVIGRRGQSIKDLTKRSEEHTSELQSRLHLVCRLLLEKKKKHTSQAEQTTPPA